MSDPDPQTRDQLQAALGITFERTDAPLGESSSPPTIPDHQLLRQIGRGSYGEVWLARNIMGTPRAVKIVYRRSFDHDRPYEREFSGIRRFEPVSRTHPSQLNVLHVGRNDDAGYFYYVMELADPVEAQKAEGGRQNVPTDSAFHIHPSSLTSYLPRTLRSDLLTRGRLPFDECLNLASALATALEHLHRHGLVHRDVKPSNIIFVNGIPKLADIGLVAQAEATLSFVGTEGYLPPEGPGTPRPTSTASARSSTRWPPAATGRITRSSPPTWSIIPTVSPSLNSTRSSSKPARPIRANVTKAPPNSTPISPCSKAESPSPACARSNVVCNALAAPARW